MNVGTSATAKGSEWIMMNDGDWKHSSPSGLVFVLDAAADYPFVNQTTLIEYDLINLSCLTLDSNAKKVK